MKYDSLSNVSEEEKATVEKIKIYSRALLIISILVAISPYFGTPSVPYEDLTETHIIIDDVRWSGRTLYLVAADGRKFDLTGDIQSDYREILTKGKEATVKYYVVKFNYQYNGNAKEVVVDGKAAVTWNPPMEYPDSIRIASGVLFFLALAGFIYARHRIKDAQKRAFY